MELVYNRSANKFFFLSFDGEVVFSETVFPNDPYETAQSLYQYEIDEYERED